MIVSVWLPLGIFSRVYHIFGAAIIFVVEVNEHFSRYGYIRGSGRESFHSVDAVLKLSSDELRQQLDLYGVDTMGLVNKPQLQKAFIKVIQPVSPVSKTKREWLLKSKQLEAAHAEADRQLNEKELEVETLKSLASPRRGLGGATAPPIRAQDGS